MRRARKGSRLRDSAGRTDSTEVLIEGGLPARIRVAAPAPNPTLTEKLSFRHHRARRPVSARSHNLVTEILEHDVLYFLPLHLVMFGPGARDATRRVGCDRW